jgi:hypothetical protein
VLFGDASDGAWFNDLKNKEVDISEMRDTLIFGQAYQGGTPLDPMAAVAALLDDAESAAATASAEARSPVPAPQRRLGSRSLCFGPRKTYSSLLRTVVRSSGDRSASESCMARLLPARCTTGSSR